MTICLLEKHSWLSAPSHMPLHSLVKSLTTPVNTSSEQARFKPQHAVCNVYFPGRMGPWPSRSTLCESIQQHAVPYATSHGHAGAAPTPRQSCLPMSSPTCASVMLQAQTHNYARAKPTTMELLHSMDPQDIQCSTLPGSASSPGALVPRCFPRCTGQEACKAHVLL